MADSDGEHPTLRILTEYFRPEESSTAQLLTELATGLADEFDVRVATAYPNYHSDETESSLPAREHQDGVEITRMRATRFHKDSVPLRVINWVTFTILACVHLLKHSDPDDRHLVLSNPPILPFAAWVTNRIHDIEYTYLIHDMYPDMPIGLGYLNGDGVIARSWENAIRAVYRDTDHIVVLGESMKRRLTEKMADDPEFSPDKIEVIHNWEDEKFVQPMNKSENDFAHKQGTTDKFTLVYSGNIGRYHDVGTAIEAIEILESRGYDDIQLLVIGEGGRKEEYQRKVSRSNIENVEFLPFQPMERLPESLTCGDASLVAIDEEMEGICVSSKLYSSLAAGDPVLAIVADGDEVARVVREYDCGAHATPGSPEEVADILEHWANNPQEVHRLGQNARECFEQNFTKQHALSAYKQHFASTGSVQG